MGLAIFRLITAGLLPVLCAMGFFLAIRNGKFDKISAPVQQLIIGGTFGVIAILATEFGIPVNGAIVNVRSAAPLTAGLIFGWPAGIISSVIGGVQRWFSQSGDFTRTACTIATFVAGIFGASIRKFMMHNKKATWFYGLVAGITVEVLHMLLVFLSNNSDIHRAFNVVQVCAIPMILANGLSVMCAILAISLFVKRTGDSGKKKENIAQTFQRWLMVCVILAFIVTYLFTHLFQTGMAYATADSTLKANILDVQQDIQDASDRNLLDMTRLIADALPEEPTTEELQELADAYKVTEINVVDQHGIVVYSSDPEILAFNMHSGEQAAEFLCLLEGTEEMVQDYQSVSRGSSIFRKYAGTALENGFVQVGYDSESFHREVHDQVLYAAQNRHIGQDGCVIICDENGIIVSDREGHQGEHISIFGDSQLDVDEMTRFSVIMYGELSYCMYTMAEGYYIIGVIPESEALFNRDASVYMQAFMEILVFSALFVLIFFLVKKLVVEKIQEINDSLARITDGDLNVTVNVRDNEEFASLSDDINSTVATLKHYIDAAKARLDKELEIARQIQHSALPSVFPPYPSRKDFSIFASMDPAKEVGGDFYDFFLLNEKTLAFSVADVSGKGIPGAMFMMTSKSIIKGLVESGLPINEVFTRANAQLCENNEAGMFVTAWMGILDLETGLIRYANAGHNPPVVRRKNGQYEYLKGRVNFVLAGMEGVRYREQQLQLEPGDELYLYTDGVTEAHDISSQLFGEERLLKSLNEKQGLTVEQICKKVKADMDVFVGEAEQFDDITMLCIRLNDMEEGAMFTSAPTMESVAQAADFAQEQMELLNVPMKTATRIMVIVDEIYSNIVRHSGATTAQLRIEKRENTLHLTFRDDGTPYNPLAAKEPDITASAEDRAIGGLGIFMVKQMADRLDYEYVQNMNKLTLVLTLPNTP